MIVEAIKLLLAYVLHVVEDAIEASANLFSDPIFWLVLCMGLVIVVAVCLDVILSRVERRSNATISQTIDSPEYSAQEDSQTSVKEAQEPQKDWPPNLILPTPWCNYSQTKPTLTLRIGPSTTLLPRDHAVRSSLEALYC